MTQNKQTFRQKRPGTLGTVGYFWSPKIEVYVYPALGYSYPKVDGEQEGEKLLKVSTGFLGCELQGPLEVRPAHPGFPKYNK